MLTALSPLDGRYQRQTAPLGPYFSELALMRYRVRVEVEYFIALRELGDRLLDIHGQHAWQSLTRAEAVRDALLEAGIVPIVPERYRLGALIRLVCEDLAVHHVQVYRAHDTVVEVRGRSVAVGGRSVLLGPSALALFKALTASDGVVSRPDLVAALPEQLDDHALEVAMSRLRRALDVPGLITTVVKRGYRFNGVRVEP